jgi:hypothetical protein
MKRVSPKKKKYVKTNFNDERLIKKEPEGNETSINRSIDLTDNNKDSVIEELKSVNKSKINKINKDITNLSNYISKIFAKLNLLDIKVTKIEKILNPMKISKMI